MIKGVGIDIVATERFEGMDQRLLSKMFSDYEIASAPMRAAEYFAARFAAKEAFSKALGTGIKGFSLPEVEVVEDDYGKPSFKLSGRALEKAGDLIFHLSMSHERDAAVAVVVAESYEK